ncbi:MAG: GNAT family N-acetyltransferase [Pseudonocardia sp.]|nr:GNAT family N-acetyltransferase [Pseudonocardia sp.]
MLVVYIASHLSYLQDPWSSPERFWARLVEMYVRTEDFGLVAGWSGSTMIGYAFGSVRSDARRIWDTVAQALPDVSVPSGIAPVYIFREFAVHPDHQGRGHGRTLHNTLLGTRGERLAHLLVRTHNERARRAYSSWGWRAIVQVRPFDVGPLTDAMVRELPIS